MAKGSFRLEGFKELDAALAELPASLARGASKRSVGKGARIMADEQERLVLPALRDTIGVSVKARNLTGLAAFGAVLGGGGSRGAAVQALRAARREGGSEGTRITATVGSSSPLARLFEFGTGPRYQKTTGRFTGVLPAQPFVRTAFDTKAGTVVAAIGRELAADIAKTSARFARRQAKLGLAG